MSFSDILGRTWTKYTLFWTQFVHEIWVCPLAALALLATFWSPGKQVTPLPGISPCSSPPTKSRRCCPWAASPGCPAQGREPQNKCAIIKPKRNTSPAFEWANLDYWWILWAHSGIYFCTSLIFGFYTRLLPWEGQSEKKKITAYSSPSWP